MEPVASPFAVVTLRQKTYSWIPGVVQQGQCKILHPGRRAELEIWSNAFPRMAESSVNGFYGVAAGLSGKLFKPNCSLPVPAVGSSGVYMLWTASPNLIKQKTNSEYN